MFLYQTLFWLILYDIDIAVKYIYLMYSFLERGNKVICKPHGLLSPSQSATNRLKLTFCNQFSLISMEQVISASLSRSPLFSLSHIPANTYGHSDRKHSLRRYMFVFIAEIYPPYLSVLVCTCDAVIRSDGQKSPSAVCLFVCVCHRSLSFDYRSH